MKSKILIEKYNPLNRFYVYAYLDPRKPGQYTYGEYTFDYEPFYVGKGSFQRYKDHLFEKKANTTNIHKYNKIQKIINDTTLQPKIIILKKYLTEENAFDLEKQMVTLIGRMDLKKGCLTNKTNGGDGGGIILTKKGKKKIIDASRKPIVQFSLDGSFLKKWYSITEAEKALKLPLGMLTLSLKKITHKTGAGFIWFYEKDFNNNIPLKLDIDIIKKLTIRNDEKIKRKIVQFSKKGEIIKNWNSIAEASRETKISPSSIVDVCKKRKKTAGEFIWKYINEI